MVHQRFARRRYGVVGATLMAVATAAGFVGPVAQPASATGTTTTTTSTTTTAVPGSNCSAALAGRDLDRSGWTASTNAPANSAYAPANALDGNYSTRFGTDEHQAPGLYFQVDMGSAQTVDEVEMSSPASPNDYARGFLVELSTNASSWSTVAACTGTGTPETVSFSAQSARYVRVVLTASTTSWWWSIDEFKVLSSSPPPTTTTTSTSTTTTTTTVPSAPQCRWPRFLVRGSLIATRHAFFVVAAPCSALRVLGVRVLVTQRVLVHQRDGRRHWRKEVRWDRHFRLGSKMNGRTVELWTSRDGWIRWDGRIFRVTGLSAIR